MKSLRKVILSLGRYVLVEHNLGKRKPLPGGREVFQGGIWIDPSGMSSLVIRLDEKIAGGSEDRDSRNLHWGGELRFGDRYSIGCDQPI